MNSLINNVFEITDSETYECIIWGYYAGHSQMYVRVYKPPFETGETFYLGFYTVIYFEGPTRWKGANFRLGTLDDRVNLLQRIRWFEDFPKEYLDGFHLFVVENPKFKVQILARDADKMTDSPTFSISFPAEESSTG